MNSEPDASCAEPARFGLDASCLVALVAEWHRRHRATVAGYERRLAAGQRPVIAGHALLECFAVLTRLPGPVRVRPETAARVLIEEFDQRAYVGVLEGGHCWGIIRELAQAGRGGGQTYAAAIALATYRAGARLLLTWDLDDMQAVAPPGLAIAEP